MDGVSVLGCEPSNTGKLNRQDNQLGKLEGVFQCKRHLPDPDVIICSSLSLFTILNGLHLKLRYRCRLVFEVRDIWPLTLVEEGGFSSWNPLILGLGLVEWLGYKAADIIVGTMPNLGAHVRVIAGADAEKKVVCVPMGYDPAFHLDAPTALSDCFIRDYIPKDVFLVTHIGSIGITNALEGLLEAAYLLREDASIKFLVVGDGDLKAAYLSKYGHLDNLIIAPKVEKSQVQSVLGFSDLLFFSAPKSRVWGMGSPSTRS